MQRGEGRSEGAALRWRSKAYHVSFVSTIAAALGFCATGPAGEPRLSVAFAALLLLSFTIAFVVQALVWRTKCPRCQQRFFARRWSPQHTWAGFPTDPSCGRCGYPLHR